MTSDTFFSGTGRFREERYIVRHARFVLLFLAVSQLSPIGGSPLSLAQSQAPPAGAKDSRPWYTVHVHVVQCCDDDGGRKCPVTAQEVVRMIDLANQIYAKARVRFVWTPRDATVLRSTVINSVIAGGRNLEQAVVESKKVGPRYPGKMVVVFRWGDDARKMTGGGFSSGDASCVFLPCFRATNAGVGCFAHEAGHYFGLSHTFAREFPGVQEASRFLKEHGGDTSVFDGDGLSDTLPDPGVPDAFNNGVTKLTLSGKEIPLPTGNIMSYMRWDGHEWMSEQQAERVRAVYRFRSRHGMACPINIDEHHRIEVESLQFETRGDLSAVVQAMRRFGVGCWSGDKQITGNGRVGGALVVKFEVKEAGAKEFKAYLTLAPDYGIVRFSVDGKPVGDAFDGFAPVVAASGPISLGRLELSQGVHTIELKLVGKNEESKGTGLGVDCLSLVAVKP